MIKNKKIVDHIGIEHSVDIISESVSYVIAKKYNLNTDNFLFTYITFIKENDSTKLMLLLDTIRDLSHLIIDQLNNIFLKRLSLIRLEELKFQTILKNIENQEFDSLYNYSSDVELDEFINESEYSMLLDFYETIILLSILNSNNKNESLDVLHELFQF